LSCGSKIPLYFYPSKSRVKITTLIYAVIYIGIFITLAPGYNASVAQLPAHTRRRKTVLYQRLQEDAKFSKEKFEKEISTLNGKLEEAQNQIRYLKDSLASAKVDLDLHLEKEDRERASFTESHRAELEMKNMAIAKLKEELADKETLLDLTREELVRSYP
jgi:chromosome segregation ATPase